jgi:two-component system NtrC family sensor kinase
MVMKKNRSKRSNVRASGRNFAEDFRVLSQGILDYASRGLPRIDFVREVLKMLIDFSGCDAVEMRVKRREKYYRCEVIRDTKPSFRFEHLPCMQTQDGRTIPCLKDDSGIEKLYRDIILGRFDPSFPFFTKNGSFWTNDLTDSSTPRGQKRRQSHFQPLSLGGNYRSLAIFSLVTDDDNMGLLQLKSKRPNHFTEEEIQLYENLAQTLRIALVHRHVQVALRERIKELTCLYGMAQLVAQPGISLEEIMQGVVELLPPAWLYPEIASARIILDERHYSTPGFQESIQKQSAGIVVGDKRRGVVEVVYTQKKPELDEGPFLKEERNLIDTVAREVAIVIERRQAEEDKSKLQEQLRHADRLATIGELAAGVAHELNEPLNNILGFAQLAKKCPGLPPLAEQDMEKVVIASLHAREIVKKLMLFARRMPPQKTQVNLNQLVEEGLYFLESRCIKEGIELKRLLSSDLPEITADPGQLTQVLVNLIVNAIQAMPQGGTLTVHTLAGKGHVSLIVEDTGVGMSSEVMKNLFVPFFTTKELDQGTGLGLPVVHGIVTSHGGSIKADSQAGQGSRFEVKLPLPGAPDVEETD